MSSSYWIHCNICAAQISKGIRIYLLSCNHLLCKSCMRHTDRGKTCPLCKKSIKFAELSKKLSGSQKALFDPNAIVGFTRTAKTIKFQRDQQVNMFKLATAAKKKCIKAAQLKVKMEQEVRHLKAEYEKCVKQREMMQAKLKEIYLRNQTKPKTQQYRESNKSLFSIDSGSKNSSNQSNSLNFSQNRPTTPRSSVSSISGFFDKDAPMMRSSKPSPSSRMSSNGSRFSQSTRKSLFA